MMSNIKKTMDDIFFNTIDKLHNSIILLLNILIDITSAVLGFLIGGIFNIVLFFLSLYFIVFIIGLLGKGGI